MAASTITSSNSAVAYAGTTSISTSGLSANAVKVLQAVNATFPQVTDIGGVRSGSDAQDHGTGHALDLMTSDKATGDEIAAWSMMNDDARLRMMEDVLPPRAARREPA